MFVTDAAKLLSGNLAALSAMVHLELPHVNVRAPPPSPPPWPGLAAATGALAWVPASASHATAA